MKRTLVIGITSLAVAWSAAAEAAKPFEKVGTRGAQFLKIGVGARAVAMGEAFVPVADDASALYWNPAGIVGIEGSEIIFHHSTWPAELGHSFVGYVFSDARIPGVFGASFNAFTMDPMNVTDPTHPEGTGETFDAGSMALGFSYARRLTDRFSTGATVKYIHLGLEDETARSFLVDLGTLYDTGYRGIMVGMSIQHVGSSMKFIEQEFPMPITFKAGLSMKPWTSGQQELLTSFEFNHPPDGDERANLGAELQLKQFEPTVGLALRGGYRLNRDEEGLAFGFGTRFPFVPMGLAQKASTGRVDYAFSDMGILGTSHKVTFGLAF